MLISLYNSLNCSIFAVEFDLLQLKLFLVLALHERTLVHRPTEWKSFPQLQLNLGVVELSLAKLEPLGLVNGHSVYMHPNADEFI